MKELQECLELKREIERLNERIVEIRAVVFSPKNQVITGMPRGGNGENVIEKYLIKLERLEERKKALYKDLSDTWQAAEGKMPNLAEQERYLLYIRFARGLPWKKCAVEMDKRYGNWNINKVFRTYRKTNNIF